MVSNLNIYNVNLKHFGRIGYLLNQYIFNLKFKQGLNSDSVENIVQTPKTAIFVSNFIKMCPGIKVKHLSEHAEEFW